MIDSDVRGPGVKVEPCPWICVASPAGRSDIVEHVVLDENSRGLARDRGIGIGAVRQDRCWGMPHDVAGKRHILHYGPRRGAFLVTGCKEDRETILRSHPVVLEDVPIEQNPLGVFELEEIFHGPVNAPVARVIELPRERLGKVVPTDLDVRGHEIRDRRVPAAEHEVFARSFEVVVDDLEGAGPVPAGDRLGVERLVVRIRDVGVDDGRGGAVQGDAPPKRDCRAPVHVDAIQDDVVRHLVERRLRRPVAKLDEATDTRVAGDAGPNGDLEPDQPIVMGAGHGRDRRGGVRADHLREHRGVGRGDACARGRQARVGR